MACPHAPQPVKQRAFSDYGEEGAAEFAALSRLMPRPHFAAELVAHHLLAITNAKDRHARIEQYLRRAGAAIIGHAGGGSRTG